MKLHLFFALALLLATFVYWASAQASDPAFSLQHLFTASDCEPLPELIGTWAHTEGGLSGTWSVTAIPGDKYRLLGESENIANPSRPAFDLCVAHLGGHLFFDAVFQSIPPDGKKPLLSEDDTLFWIPLHLIGRLDFEGDALHFRLLSDEWLRAELEAGRLELTSTRTDEGDYLLTAPSKELKQFATRFASDTDAFSYTESFERPAD
jgi:hypothetical protein